MKEEYITRTSKETEELGAIIADKLTPGSTVAFFGSMGMGKTCMTRGIAKGLGYNYDVTSPTFALVNEYIGGKYPIYHFDMYRVSGFEDLLSTGYFEYLESNGVLLVEWSENIVADLPENAIHITFERIDDNTRKITVCQGEQ